MARVLVADSDARFREQYQHMFQDELVVLVSSVAQALEYLRRQAVDLVVTEWEFPEGTAHPLLEYLDRDKSTPVVLVSGTKTRLPKLPDIVKRRVFKGPG